MYTKDWKQYKKVLSEKMKEDEAFTLIELIVVMAILAILVLLAAPQFLGYTTKAKDAKIANDVAVAEMKTSENLIDHKWAEKDFKEWHNADKDENIFVREYLIENIVIADDGSGKNGLYNKGGKIELSDEVTSAIEGMTPQEKLDYINVNGSIDIPEGNYRIIDGDFLDEEIGTNLDGTFFANEDGEVFYTPDKNIVDNSILIDDSGVVQNPSNPSNPSNPEDEGVVDETVDGIPNHYVLASDEDFVRVDVYSTGKYKYIGDDPYVIIPETIHGEKVTDYGTLFNHGLEYPDEANGGSWGEEWVTLYDEVPDYEAAGLAEGHELQGNENYITLENDPFPEYEIYTYDDNTGLYYVWVGPTKKVDNGYGHYNTVLTGPTLTIDLSNLKGVATQDASAVTHAVYMFKGLPTDSLELTYFELSATVEEILGMFNNTNFTELDLSGINFSSVLDYYLSEVLWNMNWETGQYDELANYGENSIAVGSQEDYDLLVSEIGNGIEDVLYVK